MNGIVVAPVGILFVLILTTLGLLAQEIINSGGKRWLKALSAKEHQARPRLLLAIASHLTPSGANESLSYLRRSIGELRERYVARYDVHVFIDTNNASLANAILATETATDWGDRGSKQKLSPVLPLSVREWSLEELGNDPFQLTGVHRRLMEREAGAYDFFAYLEDDMLMPLEAFEYFVKERQELWSHNWIPGFAALNTGPTRFSYCPTFLNRE